METLAPVDLDVAAMRRVVEMEGGCIAWGGAVNLSPADDVIIGVERVLDIDAVGQMVASVLSKKIAAGATHLVIDIPVGPTAKVRGADAADTLERALRARGMPHNSMLLGAYDFRGADYRSRMQAWLQAVWDDKQHPARKGLWRAYRAVRKGLWGILREIE